MKIYFRLFLLLLINTASTFSYAVISMEFEYTFPHHPKGAEVPTDENKPVRYSAAVDLSQSTIVLSRIGGEDPTPPPRSFTISRVEDNAILITGSGRLYGILVELFDSATANNQLTVSFEFSEMVNYMLATTRETTFGHFNLIGALTSQTLFRHITYGDDFASYNGFSIPVFHQLNPDPENFLPAPTTFYSPLADRPAHALRSHAEATHLTSPDSESAATVTISPNPSGGRTYAVRYGDHVAPTSAEIPSDSGVQGDRPAIVHLGDNPATNHLHVRTTHLRGDELVRYLNIGRDITASEMEVNLHIITAENRIPEFDNLDSARASGMTAESLIDSIQSALNINPTQSSHYQNFVDSVTRYMGVQEYSNGTYLLRHAAVSALILLLLNRPKRH